MKCYGCPAEATYLYRMAPSLNDIPLCAACCAAWRADAVLHPWVAPVRITLV